VFYNAWAPPSGTGPLFPTGGVSTFQELEDIAMP